MRSLNKVVKTFQVIVFIILVYLWTGQYAVTVTSMVLFLFLTDFVTLSLSTDRAHYSSSPNSWRLRGLLRGSAVLGVLLVLESVILLVLGAWLFDLFAVPGMLRTYVFCLLVIFSLFDVLILRERRRFWSSMPSLPLLISVISDIVIVSVISLVGFPELAPIDPLALLFVLAFIAIVSLTINDIVKVRLIKSIG